MSLFSRQSKRALGPWDTAETAIPRRADYSGRGAVPVTNDSALRHSGVWACLRLRANLVSTMPVDTYRKVLGVSIEVPKPSVLVNPGGERVNIQEWLYSSQIDLDRAGNCFGLITERYGTGLPARIDLQPIGDCTVVMKKGQLKYRFGGKEYDPSEVWHERQYTVSGLPFGLSPVAYAAWTIGEYLSVQEFATNWFGSGGIPKAQLKNTARTLTPEAAVAVKERFKASVENGDVWVSGNDWEFNPLAMEAEGQSWIDHKRFGIADVARFFDCPGDLIDAAVAGTSITYASITQRNLQFLIMHLAPTLIRRELSLSSLLAAPRYVKFNTSSLLRLDDATRANTVKTQIDSRTLAPSEARELEDRKPFTPTQLAEFEHFWPTDGAPKSEEPSPIELANLIQKIYLGVGKVITTDEAREIANSAGANLPIPGPDFTGESK